MEIAAVEDTIKFLNSDEAYAVLDRSVNTASDANTFLQAGAAGGKAQEAALRKRAVAVV